MAENNPHVSTLSNLMEFCKEAEKAFDEASRDVRSEEHRKVFVGYARRMSEFATELGEQVVKLGGKLPRPDTAGGEVRRVWIHFRSALNLHHTKPVLIECEKEEESLLDHFQKTIDSGLPPEIGDVVQKQFVEVIEIRNHLKELEEVLR